MISFLNILSRWPLLARIIVAFGIMGIIYSIDIATRDDVVFTLFYLVPIFFSTWLLGAPVGYAGALMCAFAWTLADTQFGLFTSPSALHFANLLLMFGVFSVIVYVLSLLKKSLEQEAKLARTDKLTGCANTMALFEFSEQAQIRCTRANLPISIAYIDCDNFKEVNDTRGHKEGDNLLVAIVDAIDRHIRQSDILARIGGDEFIIFMPEADHEQSIHVTNRIRDALSHVFAHNNWPVTVSVGLVSYLEKFPALKEMIREADTCMYRAKASGKNCIDTKVVSA